MVKVKKYLPIIFLIFVCFFFFHKLFIPTPKLTYTPDFAGSDVFSFNYGLKDFLSQSLKKNQLPLWSSKIGGGFPILAEGQIGTFNLSNLLLFKLLPTWLAFNLTIVIIFLTLLIGQYLFLRKLKISCLPSLFGSISFSFSAFYLTKITHLNHIQTASFIPLILYILECHLQKPKIKYLVFITFLISQQIFSGYPMMVLITLLLIFLRLFFEFIDKKPIIKPLISFIIVGLLALGLSAIQLFPQMEYFRLSNLKSGFLISEIYRHGYHVKNLLRFFDPYFVGNPTINDYSHIENGIYWETSIFFGLIPFLISLISLFLLNKKIVRYFLFLAIIGFLLSFGEKSPFYFVFSFFPFKLFRVPSRYLIIVLFSLTTLSALILEKAKSLISKKLFTFIMLVIISFTFYQLYSFFHSYNLLVEKNQLLKKPLLAKEFENNKQSKYLTFLPWILWTKHFYDNWFDEKSFLFLKNTLAPNSSLIWDINSENAYFTQWPLRFLIYKSSVLGITYSENKDIQLDVEKITLNEKQEKGLKIAGITHFISPISLNNKSLQLLKTVASKNGEKIYLYKTKKYNKKFWLAESYDIASTVEELSKKINNSNFDYNKMVILGINSDIPASIPKKPIALNSNNNINTDINKNDQPNNQQLNNFDNKIPSINIELNNDRKKIVNIENAKKHSLLIIIESYYPGWQVNVNGIQEKIFDANLNQQAVAIPSGNSKVELNYQPQSFKTGAIISFICLLILFALLFPAVNKHLQIPSLFPDPDNIPNKSFSKKPKHKHH